MENCIFLLFYKGNQTFFYSEKDIEKTEFLF